MSASLTLHGLTLIVEDTTETDRDGRPRFAWAVEEHDAAGLVRAWRGPDLCGPDLCGPAAGPEPTERDLLGTFCAFLGAALEARRYRERTGRPAESETLFPASLLNALVVAGVDPDELSLAADELQS